MSNDFKIALRSKLHKVSDYANEVMRFRNMIKCGIQITYEDVPPEILDGLLILQDEISIRDQEEYKKMKRGMK